jgi:uncharacterized protein
MRVSALGLGTNRLRLCTQAEATAIINRLLDLGVNYLSSGYGGTQALVGNAVSHRRDEYYITSKAGRPTAQGVREGIEESLRLLKTDYIDVYEMDYVNNDREVAEHMGPGGAYEALLEAKQKGLIRHIGLTSHRPDIIANLIGQGLFETALMMVSFAEQYALSEVLPIARKMGVGTVSIRSIDHGALHPADRALAFTLHSGVDVALSGMTSVAQVDYNVAAAERAFAMSPEEVAALKAEAAALPTTGCRSCDQCSCPYELRISFVLPLFYYRQKYGLLSPAGSPAMSDKEPTGEQMWQRNAERARVAAPNCATCGKCEPMCPFGVPIVSYVQQIASEPVG